MNTVSEVTTSRETSPSTAAAVRRRVQVPRVDVRESSDAFQIVADVPGVAADGVEVTVEENVLSVICPRSTPSLSAIFAASTGLARPVNSMRVFS